MNVRRERLVEIINTLNPRVVPEHHAIILREAANYLFKTHYHSELVLDLKLMASASIANDCTWYIQRLAGQVLEELNA